MENYGQDANSFKECPECEGDKNIVNNACEDGSLMKCPKCKGEGSIEMEYDEYCEKMREQLQDIADDMAHEQKYGKY